MKYFVAVLFFPFLAIASNLFIEGNHKTKSYIIENEIRGASSRKQAEQNLRNTNLFSKVEVQENAEKRKVTVQEKWTTIPILKFSSGGGVSQLTAGVFDPNVAGHFIELGAQYQRLEDTNSGVFWFKNPRLYGRRQGLEFQAWKVNRLRTKYYQDVDDPLIKTGFLQIRDKVYMAYSKQMSLKSLYKVFYEYNRDKFSDKIVPDGAKEKLAQTGLPIDTKFHFIGLGMDYGLINQNVFLMDGLLIRPTIQYGISEGDGAQDFVNVDLELRYYHSFGDHTFAQRFLTGGTNTKVLQYWNYLGGLDRIRGFVDNRFSGRYFWLSNSEYRMPFVQKLTFVLQGVAFLDIANTRERLQDYASVIAASAGPGLRIILPRVYRAVLRFDYATHLKKDDEQSISFGVQQFF